MAGLFAIVAAQSEAVESCPADADGNGIVSIGELIGAVRNGLDGCPTPPEVCHGDVDCDGAVSIAELVQAVGAALDGCVSPLGLRVVSAAWLMAEIDNPLVQVIDARVGAFPGGHIPGALPLSPYDLATTVDGIGAQIVDVETAAAQLSAIGLRRPSIAVVYGAAPEFDPARVVWALSYFGHRDVRYLDGGWDAWTAAGGAVAVGDPLPGPATNYVIDGLAAGLRVDGEWILDRLGAPPYDDPEIQVIDARSPAEYAAGYIPSAIHRQWTINLEDGLLRPRQELEALYAGLDKARTTVVYCLAGWRASLAWLALVELGFEDVRVYDGSWLEWGDPERGFPIELPQFSADGISAVCRLINKGGPAAKPDLIEVRVALANDSGFELRDVVPGELSIEGDVPDLELVPPARAFVPNLGSAYFEWAFDLEGTVRVGASLTALGPGDQPIAIGPLDCGTATGR